MSARRKGRELALQVLYQLDMSGETSEQGLHAFADSFDVSPKAREFAWNLVRGVREQRVDIDAQVEAASENWKLERLAQIDATVIRIAVYEMTHGLPIEIRSNNVAHKRRRQPQTTAIQGRVGFRRNVLFEPRQIASKLMDAKAVFRLIHNCFRVTRRWAFTDEVREGTMIVLLSVGESKGKVDLRTRLTQRVMRIIAVRRARSTMR